MQSTTKLLYYYSIEGLLVVFFQGRFVAFIRIFACCFCFMRFKRVLRIGLYSFLLLAGCSKLANASAYVGTQDKQLHYDLQTLVEWGHLDVAVTTYPVAWKGIAQGLDSLSPENMSFRPRQAYFRLNHYLSLNKQQQNRRFLALQGASDDVRLRSFDDGAEETGKLSIASEFYAGRWSGQVTVNYAKGGEKNFDNSFIAYQYGGWNLRLGSLDQWWGPAQSSSLIMSNNTRPIKAIALSRSVNTATQSPLLNWLGPWYFTAQMGQLENDRAVPKTKMMMNRFNARPFKGFEFGLSWTAMWGGQGQPENFKSLFEVITLSGICPPVRNGCRDSGKTKRGNHLAGIDLSYTTHLLDRPWTFYMQRVRKDGPDVYKLTDTASLFGFSTYIDNTKIFIESSNTNANCEGAATVGSDCYYENKDYPSGYRTYDRTFGSTFDNDAKQVTIGANIRLEGGEVAEVFIRSAELNADGRRPSPVLTKDITERVLEISGFYQKPMGDWLLKAGGSIANRNYAMVKDEVDAVVYLKAQLAF